MIIYESEKEIEHLISNNTTTSVVSAIYSDNGIDANGLVAECVGEACSCNNIRSIAAKQSSSDVMPIASILVSDTWNANNDIFTAEELVSARNTPQYKPINWMHRGSEDTKNETIGVMVSSSLVKGGLDSLKYFTDSDVSNYTQASTSNTLSSKVHIRQDGLIWSQYFPSYVKKIEKGIEKGDLYVSMECFFEDFDYALKDKEGNIEVVSRDNASASLSKQLKQYGGSGSTTFKGKKVKVGRILRNIVFSGQGIVKEPANVDSDDRILSIILNNDTLLSAQSQVNSPTSSPLGLDSENGPEAPSGPGVPGESGMPETGPTGDSRILPSTYIDPDQYLFNTPEEARDVAENELGCTGYHVYLEDRHSDTPYLLADLLGDPDDIERQFRRPRYLPCSNHAEYLLLLDKEGQVGDHGGGAKQSGCSEDVNVCLSLSPNGAVNFISDTKYWSFYDSS